MHPITIRIHVEPARWMKRAMFFGGAVGAMALAGAAFGAPPVAFVPGQTLTAADLNENFDALDTSVATVSGKVTTAETDITDLDTRVTALEAPPPAPTFLTATGTTTAVGPANGDVVYQGMSVDLTPGSWRIDGFLSLSSQGNADGVQIALWNDTTMMEVPNSRSAVSSTGFTGACPAGGCFGVSMTTSTVITVAVNTKIKVRALRNGASQVVVIPQPGGLSSVHRLTALKLQ